MRPGIAIVAYQAPWPEAFASEAQALRALAPAVIELDHIGSTAVPGLAAKPVIDMIGAVATLEEITPLLPSLHQRGDALVETGMRNRLLLQRGGEPGFNLHIVTLAIWHGRKRRVIRDAMIADPRAAAEYATLTQQPAVAHGDDNAAYTRAKTALAFPAKRSGRTDRPAPLLVGLRPLVAAREEKSKTYDEPPYSCSVFRCSAICTSRTGVGVAIPSPPS